MTDTVTISTAGLQVAKQNDIIREPNNNIRILKSTNHLKLPVARVISDWLGAADRSWSFTGSVDKNSDRLIQYLIRQFPDHTWMTVPSQKCFDIVSPTAEIIIENKSFKSGASRVTSNSSIYPSKVEAQDVLSKRMISKLQNYNPTAQYDVLVACVERKANTVFNYAIVDGAYWGFTTEDYKHCRALFNNLNNDVFKAAWMKTYKELYKDDTFMDRVANNKYGRAINMELRQRITLSNPINSLNSAGWWDVK